MELFARRDLYMYLVVLALLLPLPAAAQTVGKLYATCPAGTGPCSRRMVPRWR